MIKARLFSFLLIILPYKTTLFAADQLCHERPLKRTRLNTAPQHEITLDNLPKDLLIPIFDQCSLTKQSLRLTCHYFCNVYSPILIKSGIHYNQHDYDPLFDFIENHPSTRELNLSISSTADYFHYDLKKRISLNKTLMFLKIAHSNLTDLSLQMISAGLKKNTTLKSITLYSCTLRTAGICQLMQCLEKNTTLKSLTLEKNQIIGLKLPLLWPPLASNTTLTTLHLMNNTWNPTRPPIENWPSFKIPIMRDDNLTYECPPWPHTLSWALGINKSITNLALQMDLLSREEYEPLAIALSQNPALTELCLSPRLTDKTTLMDCFRNLAIINPSLKITIYSEREQGYSSF